MTNFIQVLTAIGSKDDAQKIAVSAVSKRLAACAQVIGPITSTYWWQGAIETAEEWLCLLKTREDLYPDLEQDIRANHPYDVPEIVAMPVIAVVLQKERCCGKLCFYSRRAKEFPS